MTITETHLKDSELINETLRNSMKNLKSDGLNVVTIDLKQEINQWKRIILYVGLIFVLMMLCQSVFASVSQQCPVLEKRFLMYMAEYAICLCISLFVLYFLKKFEADKWMWMVYYLGNSTLFLMISIHFIFVVARPCLLD